MFLPDVNVLIALFDSFHPHHAAARRFLPGLFSNGWATCPITENGLLRIWGHVNYPRGPGSPTRARSAFDQLLKVPSHQFWADDLSLLDSRQFPLLPMSKAITDFYLLALAAKHHAYLATFDARIDPSLIPDGSDAYHLIPTA